ncbi:uncharacterized protein LOC34619939 [Cyclospora cayetanensis]|uniref:Cleavage and polyadenylation specificity factor subunit 2 n=1 Tax=Cyclospora cayetanensis TaxID=88456 RepID=A0A6P6S1X8_9EIME|nr:uncharacterized protein LOC34619939 [Cyclospora cayetanensis]
MLASHLDALWDSSSALQQAPLCLVSPGSSAFLEAAKPLLAAATSRAAWGIAQLEELLACSQIQGGGRLLLLAPGSLDTGVARDAFAAAAASEQCRIIFPTHPQQGTTAAEVLAACKSFSAGGASRKQLLLQQRQQVPLPVDALYARFELERKVRRLRKRQQQLQKVKGRADSAAFPFEEQQQTQEENDGSSSSSSRTASGEAAAETAAAENFPVGTVPPDGDVEDASSDTSEDEREETAAAVAASAAHAEETSGKQQQQQGEDEVRATAADSGVFWPSRCGYAQPLFGLSQTTDPAASAAAAHHLLQHQVTGGQAEDDSKGEEDQQLQQSAAVAACGAPVEERLKEAWRMQTMTPAATSATRRVRMDGSEGSDQSDEGESNNDREPQPLLMFPSHAAAQRLAEAAMAAVRGGPRSRFLKFRELADATLAPAAVATHSRGPAEAAAEATRPHWRQQLRRWCGGSDPCMWKETRETVTLRCFAEVCDVAGHTTQQELDAVLCALDPRHLFLLLPPLSWPKGVQHEDQRELASAATARLSWFVEMERHEQEQRLHLLLPEGCAASGSSSAMLQLPSTQAVAGLSARLWGEALHHGVYVHEGTPLVDAAARAAAAASATLDAAIAEADGRCIAAARRKPAIIHVARIRAIGTPQASDGSSGSSSSRGKPFAGVTGGCAAAAAVLRCSVSLRICLHCGACSDSSKKRQRRFAPSYLGGFWSMPLEPQVLLCAPDEAATLAEGGSTQQQTPSHGERVEEVLAAAAAGTAKRRPLLLLGPLGPRDLKARVQQMQLPLCAELTPAGDGLVVQGGTELKWVLRGSLHPSLFCLRRLLQQEPNCLPGV